MSANIQPEHFGALEVLTPGEHENFALFTCFLDGEPAVAIVVVTPPEFEDGEYQITPLFVGVTEGMAFTDHDGSCA